MKKITFKDILPHLIAIAVFFLIALIYCLPLFQGQVVSQFDMIGVKGMTQQSFEFAEKNGGHFPLWTNSMFGGMPTFQIFFLSKYNVGILSLHSLFTGFLPGAAGLFFLSCIGFYILTRALNLKPWIGILGSLAYAYASYSAVIAVVGHVTKFATMGYAPAVLAGLILLIKRKYILGFALTLMFSTLFFAQNHVQMVYYFMLLFVCLGIGFLIRTIMENSFKHFFTAAGLAIVAIVISTLTFAVVLLPTNEYAKETMRGGRSELTLDTTVKKDNKSKGGLDKDYAFGWSYGKAETFTFVLPSFNGGSTNADELPEDSRVAQALAEGGLNDDAVAYYKQFFSAYWGDQPNTSGPVYFGAIICMLFIAGLFVIPRKYLCWLIPGTILGIVFAWGSNFAAVNYFLFDHLPALNKFRSPSSALVVPQLTFAIMASLAVQQMFYGNLERSLLLKRLKYAAIACGALIVILAGVYFSSSFSIAKDKNTKEQIAQQFTQMMARGKQPAEAAAAGSTLAATASRALIADRKGLFGGDLIWLVLFMGAGGFVVWLGVTKKIKADLAVILLGLISFIDLIRVDTRYLNKTHYTSPDEYMAGLNPTTADLAIKQQDQGYFRVFDRSSGGDPFQSSRASYFHNSVGGYSPAKLALYEDLKNYQLAKGNEEVYNMLNTKWFILPDQSDRTGKKTIAQQNDKANGAVWFVKAIKYVNSANEEMLGLDSLHSKDTVLIDKREQPKVSGAPQFDSAATISIVDNKNDEINYKSNSTTPQFAVFSEIYYPHGWKAYIDNKETPIARVDYAFRGMSIPPGSHNIRFEFKPETYERGSMLSLIGGIITLIALVACAFLLYWNYRKQQLKKPA